MSRAIKELMTQEYRDHFDGLEHCVVVNFGKVSAEGAAALRGELANREMRLRVIKNNLARRAFAEVGIEGLGDFFEGRLAVITGGSDAIEIAKTLKVVFKGDQIQLQAGVLEREVFGPDRVQLLATMLGRAELMSRILGIFLSPAQTIVSAANSPGARIASQIQVIAEGAGGSDD